MTPKHFLLATAMLASSLMVQAQDAVGSRKNWPQQSNPIVQTAQTTDPAPFVWNDTLYVYTGHDELNADFFWMYDWHVYSTTDMVNWTEHPAPLSLKTFKWAKDRAWAAQLCERGGKFYWYVCATSALTNTMAIGVAVGNSPTGPFVDAIGKPLYEGSWDYIDPTVLVDDDGRAYIYWGNPKLYYAELNEDMVSLKTDVKYWDQDTEAFKTYTEGPWITKQGDKYHMLYAAGGVPEHIAYSTAKTPLGPWTYGGVIMPQSISDKEKGTIGTDAFTNHCGLAHYRGRDFFFYHNGWLGGGFGRAAAVEEFKYNKDGSFPTIHPTREGITQPVLGADGQGLINPYNRVQAETMAFSEGVHTEVNSKTGVYVSDIHNGDYIKLRSVCFSGQPTGEIAFRVASALYGGTIEMHLDSLNGPLMARANVEGTGGWEQWQTVKTPLLITPSGQRDVYFVFKGYKGVKLMNFDWWQMSTAINNPWLWSDVPDPDIIRVGDYYYMVSTTMHLMPGAPVMRSRDLVSWQTVSYLFDSIKDTPRYDLTDPEGTGTVYGRGQWATSLRYHKGTFWALFSPNDEPHKSFLLKTSDPAKGWTLHARLPHFHDASLFFDDDDKCYVFSGSGQVRVVELNESLTDIKQGGLDVMLNNRQLQPEGLLEGSRVLKHDGYYYLLMIAWPSDGRKQLAFRSKDIAGPYEVTTILKSNFGGFPLVGQGTIVDGKDGEWYGVIFQDRGGVGRVLTLSPCTWVNGWPMLGDKNGKVPQTMQLYPEKKIEDNYISIVESDDFSDASSLNKAAGNKKISAWQWNHNPLDSAWSLSQSQGFLRLHTVGLAKTLYHARNTITQRMEGPKCSGTVTLDVSNMKYGDRCGLAAFNGHSAIMTIERKDKQTFLVLSYEEVTLNNVTHAITDVKQQEVARVSLGKAKRVMLRINADFKAGHNDNATFGYSTNDGRKWNNIGDGYQMRFDYTKLFMGTKFAIFNYATRTSGGYVNVDDFCYERMP